MLPGAARNVAPAPRPSEPEPDVGAKPLERVYTSQVNVILHTEKSGRRDCVNENAAPGIIRDLVININKLCESRFFHLMTKNVTEAYQLEQLT
ncbi:hypothetical protein F2P81_010922 [Scophthalmus maximus]|uniref:Uncharacterized protein n=1 Tax=Scophthalmus maximus TaxID=52904 RepID=A0A6A4T167_SCOMX|nr:hypothetical protein F2P81_010922 [Scophthalmus maximus]